jgi:preprotein translocase subunit SecA
MAQESVRETIDDMRHHVVDDVAHAHMPADSYPEQWDMEGLKTAVVKSLNLDAAVADWTKEEGVTQETVIERLRQLSDEAYVKRVDTNGAELMGYVEKQVLLQSLDHLWREHLVTLDQLRQVVGWRGYAQRDPLNEYKAEAFQLYGNLVSRLHETVTGQLMRVEVMMQPPPMQAPPTMQAHHFDPVTGEDEMAVASLNAGDPFRSAASMLGFDPTAVIEAPAPQRKNAALEQGRAQRHLPLRLRQEIQALPRPLRRLTRQRRAPTFSREREGALALALPALSMRACCHACLRNAPAKSWHYQHHFRRPANTGKSRRISQLATTSRTFP